MPLSDYSVFTEPRPLPYEPILNCVCRYSTGDRADWQKHLLNCGAVGELLSKHRKIVIRYPKLTIQDERLPGGDVVRQCNLIYELPCVISSNVTSRAAYYLVGGNNVARSVEFAYYVPIWVDAIRTAHKSQATAADRAPWRAPTQNVADDAIERGLLKFLVRFAKSREDCHWAEKAVETEQGRLKLQTIALVHAIEEKP